MIIPGEHRADAILSTGESPEVRILSSKRAEKTKGCAFVEFGTAAALQKALRLHHHPFSSSETETKARKINVELSAGGGGTSASRQRKLKEANERLAKQRDKRAAKEVKEVAEKKARGEQVVDETAVKKGVRVEKAEGKKKVRKVTSGANAIALG